jgi:hypothetical protein
MAPWATAKALAAGRVEHFTGDYGRPNLHRTAAGRAVVAICRTQQAG